MGVEQFIVMQVMAAAAFVGGGYFLGIEKARNESRKRLRVRSTRAAQDKPQATRRGRRAA